MVTCASLSCVHSWSTEETRCPKCQTLPIGALVGYRYKIKKIIGKGGFCITYLVEDTDCFKEVYVLKQLRRIFDDNGYDQEGNEIAERLFKREAAVLLKLRHPGIPKLHAYFTDEGYYYLVQDFIPGQTLAEEVILRNYAFDEKEARNLLVDLANILDYLHTHKPPIIHRDIKPENLMRHSNGQVLLIDFGAVCHKVANTANRTLIYSPGYTAPEQLAGYPAPQSDLYSAGAAVLRLLANDTITTKIKLSKGHWESFIPVTPEFASIVNDLLIPDVNKRIASANELKWRLQLLPEVPQIVGKPISPRPQYSINKPVYTEVDNSSSPTSFYEDTIASRSNPMIEIGQLKDQPFLFLLQRIWHEQSSGSLRFTNSNKINKSIIFYQGNIVSAYSTEATDQLDDLLIRISNIAADAFEKAKLEMSSTTCSFSDALLKMKVISQTQLNRLHNLQISQIVCSLFNWTDGEYELRCEPNASLKSKVSLPIADLIFEGLRRLESPTLIKTWLGDFSRLVTPNSNLPKLIQYVNLTPKEAFVLSRINGNTSISDLISLDCLPEKEVLTALCGLLATGLLDWARTEKIIDRSTDSIAGAIKEMCSAPTANNFQKVAAFCYEIESIVYRLETTNYYTLLDIASTAKDKEILQAYKDSIKRFHPDTNSELCRQNPNLKPQLEKVVTYITNAYRVLSNPFTRKQYDSNLKLNRPHLAYAKEAQR